MNDIWKAKPEKLKPEELIAWALTEVAHAIHKHYYWMGTADAATPMGALEHVAAELKGIGAAIYDVGSRIEISGK